MLSQKKITKIFLRVVSILLFFFIASCSKEKATPVPTPPPVIITPTDTVPSIATVRSWLVDKNATEQTAALFYNLKKVAKTNILFGHQDDTKRGVLMQVHSGQMNSICPQYPNDKSDVKEVTGAYPAVYGHDFIHIANFTNGNWYDYETQIANELTIEAYNRGGINTYAWHYWNPVLQGDFYWDKSPVEAVSRIIPGGSHHNVFKTSLKEIADFAKTLLGADGKLVPVIFRPFHEFDGAWFWWGAAHCTPAEYKSLYQFTVIYLRDSLGVRNFLYAWSPDRNFNSESEYLQRYPGDAFVDVVGMDNYWDLNPGTSSSVAGIKLKIISDYGKKSNKIAALTETGLDKLTQADWYTQMLLKVLQYQQVEIAFAMVWANTKDAYWTPYKGHAAELDFLKFRNDTYILFGDKMPNMYQLK